MNIKNLIAVSVRQPNIGNIQIIDWAIQRIQDLEQENAELKSHNAELQRYNVGLAISEAELKHDRNQLKAEVEALKPYKDNHIDLMNHINQHDADVIEKFINEVSDQRGYAVEGRDTCWVVDVEDMENYVQQLRQKAQVTK